MRTYLLLLFLFSFLYVSANPPELTKKVKKELGKYFNSNNIELLEIKEISNGKDIFYKAMNQGKEVGIVVLSSAKGRFDKFDFMVVYNADLQIELIKILVYRSQYGSEVTGKRWLSQCYGRKEDSLKYGSDVQAISGATFSAISMTKNINRINKMLNEYFAE